MKYESDQDSLGHEQEVEVLDFNCLIASHNPLYLTILEILLEKWGFKKVVVVSNGLTAVEEVLKTAQPNSKRFDLIMLDLNMPVLDGCEAQKLIVDHFNTYKGSRLNSLSRKAKCKDSMPIIIAIASSIDEETRQKAHF